MPQFIPSILTPGKHFIVDTYKPQRGPCLATASEVQRTEGGGFTFMPFSDPHLRVPFEGRNTDKNRAVALSKLLAEMKERKWIAEDATL